MLELKSTSLILQCEILVKSTWETGDTYGVAILTEVMGWVTEMSTLIIPAFSEMNKFCKNYSSNWKIIFQRNFKYLVSYFGS